MANHKTYYLDPSYWRFNDTSTETTAFTSAVSDGGKFNSGTNTTALQTDGKIIIGGGFTYNNVSGRLYLIRTNADGTLDTDFMTNAVDGSKFAGSVQIVTLQPDGKILVGGSFTYNQFTAPGRRGLIRLNSDGTTDVPFCQNASDFGKISTGSVRAIVLQPDGKILIGGTFSNYAGVSGRNGLIRLNADGTLDTAFCANASDAGQFISNGYVYSIYLQNDGKILVGGDFNNYLNGVFTKNLVRLNSDGTLDTAFSQAVNFAGGVLSVTCSPSGKIFVGGGFTNYGTSGRSRLVKLNADGTTDADFCANASDNSKFGANVRTVSVQTDGKILVGGDFVNYNSTSGRSRLVRLNADGTTDTSFCTNFVDNKFNFSIYSATQFDEKIMVNGDFTNYEISGRSSFIQIPRDYGGGSLRTEGVFKDPTGAFVLNPLTLNGSELKKTSILTKAQIDTHNRTWQATTLKIPNAADFTLANWTANGWGSSITEILVNYNQFITANFATSAITLEVNPANYTQSTLLVSGTISGTTYFLPICYFGETGSIAKVVGTVTQTLEPASIFAGSLFRSTTSVVDQFNGALEGIPVNVKTSTGTILGSGSTSASGSSSVLCTAPDIPGTITVSSETSTSTPVSSSTTSYVVSTGATLKTGTEPFVSTSGFTQPISGSQDDSNFQLPTFPFPWYFFGTNYASSAYLGSNTYITFGFGSSTYSGLSATNPGRGILVGASDNSWQRVWHGTKTINGRTVFIIRYEGNGSTSGTVGSPGIVVQWTFFEGQKLNINVGVHNRLDGAVGISNGTNFNYSGTWTLAQNTTYALRSDPEGNNWTVYPGQYFVYESPPEITLALAENISTSEGKITGYYNGSADNWLVERFAGGFWEPYSTGPATGSPQVVTGITRNGGTQYFRISFSNAYGSSDTWSVTFFS